MNAFTLIFQIVWLLAGISIISLSAILLWDILQDYRAKREIEKLMNLRPSKSQYLYEKKGSGQ